MWNSIARDIFSRGNHTAHRNTKASTDIEEIGRTACQEVVRCFYVRFSQIIDVNKVTNTSSIRGWIVIAKNFQLVDLALLGHEKPRNKVRLWIVTFPNFSVWIAASGIEISQNDKAQVVSLIKIDANFLHHQF